MGTWFFHLQTEHSILSSKCLVLLMGTWFFHLQTEHSILSTSFFVVFAFFLKIGFDWPPKPCCLRSYLLLPWACLLSADFLYWVTLNLPCLLHLAQYVFLALGTFTILTSLVEVNQ